MRRGASLTSPGWRSCVSPCLGEALQWGGGVAHLSGVEKLRVSVSGGGTAVGRGRRSPLRGGEAASLRVWGRRCSEEGDVTHLSGVEKLRVSVSGGGTAVGRGTSLTSPGWRSCVSPCLGEALQWGGGRHSPLRGGEAACLRVWGGGTAVGRGESLTSPGWRSCVSPCLGEALQ